MFVCFQSTFWTTTAPEWAVAIGTLALAFVAVFQEWLRERLRSPQLRLNKPHVGPPESEKTINKLIGFDLTGLQLSQPLHQADVYYFRFGITNEGKSAAKDVQVYLADVKRQKADGTYGTIDRFTPLNLTWTHLNNNPTLPILSPGMPPRLCDLGHITNPSEKAVFAEDLPGTAATVPIFALNLEVKPNSLGHLLGPGTYLLDLIVVASNCSPRHYDLKVVFPGTWFDSPEQMFSDGFGMSLIDN